MPRSIDAAMVAGRQLRGVFAVKLDGGVQAVAVVAQGHVRDKAVVLISACGVVPVRHGDRNAMRVHRMPIREP